MSDETPSLDAIATGIIGARDKLACLVRVFSGQAALYEIAVAENRTLVALEVVDVLNNIAVHVEHLRRQLESAAEDIRTHGVAAEREAELQTELDKVKLRCHYRVVAKDGVRLTKIGQYSGLEVIDCGARAYGVGPHMGGEHPLCSDHGGPEAPKPEPKTGTCKARLIFVGGSKPGQACGGVTYGNADFCPGHDGPVAPVNHASRYCERCGSRSVLADPCGNFERFATGSVLCKTCGHFENCCNRPPAPETPDAKTTERVCRCTDNPSGPICNDFTSSIGWHACDKCAHWECCHDDPADINAELLEALTEAVVLTKDLEDKPLAVIAYATWRRWEIVVERADELVEQHSAETANDARTQTPAVVARAMSDEVARTHGPREDGE